MIEWFECSKIPPPDDGNEYLTFGKDNFSVGTFMCKDDDESYFFSGCGPIWNVTHWAELPEKPKPNTSN